MCSSPTWLVILDVGQLGKAGWDLLAWRFRGGNSQRLLAKLTKNVCKGTDRFADHLVRHDEIPA